MEKKIMSTGHNKRSAVISLIGRPNVGKSSLFNRLMRKNYKAMTHDLPGVTRDRHYGIASLMDRTEDNPQDVILVDTGGFYPEKVEEVKKLGKKKTAEPFFNLMADHAKIAIEESDLILFVVDVREGLLPFDKSICDYIRTTKKKMWLLVNKFDSDAQWGNEADFYELGLNEDQYFILSAEHGRGLGELRERLYDFTTAFNKEISDTEEVQKGVKPNYDVVSSIALIGAPNAGKSTLLNNLVGAQRAVVSNIAGTTVDPIEGYFDLFFGKEVDLLKAQKNAFRKTNMDLYKELVHFEDEFHEEELIAYENLTPDMKDSSLDENDDAEMSIDDSIENDIEEQSLFSIDDMSEALNESDEVKAVEIEDYNNPYRSIKIVDTAGIRKQSNVKGFIEEQSVYRSLRAITEADVVVYMVDATKGISHQDRRLIDVTLERGKSLMICLNKIDLMRDVIDDPKRKKDWLLDLRASIPWLNFCELLTISAKKGSHLGTFRKSLMKTIIVRNKKLPTSKINKCVSGLIDRHPVVLQKAKGASFKVKYVSMLKSSPPTFLLFTNKSKGVPMNYKKYLQNGLRSEFGLINTPVHLIFRTAADIEKRLKKTQLDM